MQPARSIHFILGRLGNERGVNAEARVVAAMRTAHKPPWIRSVERAPARLDRRGVDVIVRSDVGDLYLQVKSSRRGREAFLERERRLPIACIVVRIGESDERVAAKVISAAGELRARFLAERRPVE